MRSGAAEQTYDKSLNDQKDNSQKLYEQYMLFHMIQQNMPDINNMSEKYPDEQERLLCLV